MKKKILLLSLCLAVIAGTGIIFFSGKRQPEQEEMISESTETISETEPEVSENETETFLENAPEFPVVPLSVPEVNPQEVLLTAEAEHAKFSGALHSEEREECSNGQYVTGFSGQEENTLQAAFMIPTAQHYHLTISVRAEISGTNALLLNGQEVGQFTLTDTEHFTRVTVSGVYLPAGQVELAIQQIDGNIDVDYFEISDDQELQKIHYQHSETLTDPQASASAQKLMQYLKENYGNHIFTGQYVDGEGNAELNEVYRITGKYPAIRFGDMRSYSLNTTAEKQNIISSCEQWAEQGGIVGLIWNWDAPEGTASVYAEETNFSLADAIPKSELTEGQVSYFSDVAMLENIESAVENHEISESCAAILKDIDQIAEALKPLAEKDIPVLWRPLHEAGGGWYWWSADGAQSYRWLWDILYRRMTEFHGLHNLIWIWNGQSKEWLVDKYDIASMDIYLEEGEEFGSRYEEFVSLYKMTKKKKILALSECSTVPDMNLMFRDRTVWSFMGLWYGKYFSSVDEQKLIEFYNSERAITLDKLKTAP